MKFSLVIIEGPNGDATETYTDAVNLANSIDFGLRGITGVTRLNQFAYICDLAHGLSGTNALVAAASARKYQSRTLFFDDAPPFVISK